VFFRFKPAGSKHLAEKNVVQAATGDLHFGVCQFVALLRQVEDENRPQRLIAVHTDIPSSESDFFEVGMHLAQTRVRVM
jgi:hypothetical protein